MSGARQAGRWVVSSGGALPFSPSQCPVWPRLAGCLLLAEVKGEGQEQSWSAST